MPCPVAVRVVVSADGERKVGLPITPLASDALPAAGLVSICMTRE